MFFKVAFDTGRVKNFDLPEPPSEPFTGFRVMIEEEGNTGIITDGATEGKRVTSAYPDKLPLILPHHISVLRELARFYRVPFPVLLFNLLPSSFIKYREKIIFPRTKEGLDRKTAEVVSYIEKRKYYTYDRAVRRFGKDIIDSLIKKGILGIKEEWTSREEEVRLFRLGKDLKEALSRVRKPEMKRLLIKIGGEGTVREEDIIKEGFSKRQINSLLKKGILVEVKEADGREAHVKPKRQKIRVKRTQEENFLLWGHFDSVCDFISAKHNEGEGSTLVLSTSKSHLTKIEEKGIPVIKTGVEEKLLKERWLSAHEGNMFIAGSFSASLIPLPDLDNVIVLDDHLPSVKHFKEPHIDIRNLAFLIAKESGSSFGIGSPAPSLESFYLMERGIFKKDINLLKKIKVEVVKRHYGEILTREAVGVLNDKTATKLIISHKKGYGYMYCERCQFIAECPICGSFLTFFRSAGYTLCTKCKFKEVENRCPECGHILRDLGIGIERVMEITEKRWGIREDIFFDTNAPWSSQFDYVIVVNGENILSVPDYRADEQFYSFLWRCLTTAKKGLIVQSIIEDHPALESIEKKDPFLFLKRELERRREEELPPFTRIISLKVKGGEETKILRNFLKGFPVDIKTVKAPEGIRVAIKVDRHHTELIRTILDFLRRDFHKFAVEIIVD